MLTVSSTIILLVHNEGVIINTDIMVGMSFDDFGRSAFRLLVSVVLSGVIGWNRERRKQGAGLRTHILVGIAATSFMVLGEEISKQYGGADPMRIIQGVAMGIGFLGAGTILQIPAEHKVQGLTTAASLWAVSAVGLAVGAGLVGLALTIVALTMGVLVGLKKFEKPHPHMAMESKDLDA